MRTNEIVMRGKMFAIWQVVCATCEQREELTFNHSSENPKPFDAELAKATRDLGRGVIISKSWSPAEAAKALGWKKRKGEWHCPLHAKDAKGERE